MMEGARKGVRQASSYGSTVKIINHVADKNVDADRSGLLSRGIAPVSSLGGKRLCQIDMPSRICETNGWLPERRKGDVRVETLCWPGIGVTDLEK